ncbi:amidohydrolase family protein [Microbacterium sp. QXD-8]|uniref:Amidohydrolase family protein n=1 Tax=Microbacterium psychrotolerans TaxID=3068321 RepID=A0ABU0YYZ7_9MICO|nr:amidohydrolase family protein [Microbacterium sp. QXD-8]MDQ7876963.1 amidohydrolase family protein [Microbacterium sp. QXD-8]
MSAGIVDAHVHVWDLERFPLSWFRDDLRLPRAATVAALTDAAAAASRPLAAAVAVQAADTHVEMQWLRDLARRDSVVRWVVLQYAPATGWAGVTDAVRDERVRGIRVATPGGSADLSDLGDLDRLCDGAGATGRVIELLARPAQLDAVAHLARRHPGTTFVLCHLGLGAGAPDGAWAESLARVGARPNLAAKFSGLATAPGDHDRLSALAETAVDAFGAERLMFGSDWPMSARVVPYARLVDDVERTWAARPDAFWGATATALYGL